MEAIGKGEEGVGKERRRQDDIGKRGNRRGGCREGKEVEYEAAVSCLFELFSVLFISVVAGFEQMKTMETETHLLNLRVE